MRRTLYRSVLSLAVGAALSFTASARDLGQFDVNVAAASATQRLAKQSEPSLPQQLQHSRDVLGREAFTWVQRDLPHAAKAGVRNPEQAARLHLSQLLQSAKRAGADLDHLKLVEVAEQEGSSALLRFRAEIDGIEIFHEELAVLLDRSQRLVAMRGPLPRESATAAKSLAAFQLDAAAAIGKALEYYEFQPGAVAKLKAEPAGAGYVRLASAKGKQSASGAWVTEAPRAKPVYFRTRASLQPAWYVETQIADTTSSSADYYAFVISALDGATLFRHNQTAHASEFTYRVWAENTAIGQPLPSPEGRAAVPDPDGMPGHNQVPFINSELRTRANSLFSQSATDGWLDANATTTSGNNVNAYADIVQPDGFNTGDLQPSMSSPASFDYALNPNIAVNANNTQRLGATVQMFYWLNWLHDWFYDSGFDEAAGNAQLSNYGRGGLGGDPIRAEAQDYDTPNNANMATPADGASPRTQMGISTSGPSRDNSIDGPTLSHEWGHYLSNRLVANSSGLITEHSRGMGEGWSDFVALLAMVKEEDAQKAGNDQFQGAYSISSYSDVDSYYGVRRYPYSTDVTKNPHTLRHISDSAQLPAIPGPSFRGINSNTHSQGEIWASALWDGYAALLNDRSRLSFDEAQRRMKAYLISGMKLTPVAPTMVEARDALLASMLAAGEQRDFELFSAAFAKRGLGAGARIPDRYSETMEEVVESREIGGSLEVLAGELGVPSGCDTDTALDVGETANLVVTVRNNGFSNVGNARVQLSSTNPAISFPQGNAIAIGDLPLFAVSKVQLPIKLNQTIDRASTISVTATPVADSLVAAPASFSVSTLAQFDQLPRSSASEEFGGLQTSWTNNLQSEVPGGASWTLNSEGSTRFVNGSDLNTLAVTWFESPRMATGSGNLSIQLKHRYAFEFDDAENYDGGVIEVSTDGGATWSAIDPAAAGFAVKPLSDCCRNPLAGRRAVVGINSLYPVFEEQTINLGTAYANQANFRIRFGVATDASVNVRGWDIDRISVSGLADTPFDQVVDQPASCSIDSHKRLQGGLSGTYYDPQRSGEGVLLDFGTVGETPILFFTWYTYEDGQQRWLVGSTPIDTAAASATVDLISTSGAEFGEAFRSDDVISRSWGNVAVSFPSCDQVQLTYKKSAGETGTLTLDRGLQRLASGQCGSLHGGLSGTYYSEERSGEGVLVDFGRVGDQPTQFFTWYTYQGGQQRWLVGSQSFSAEQAELSVPLIETRGARFGTRFDAADVISSPWGEVSQRFVGCDTLELTYRRADGQTATQRLNRGLQRLEGGECR